MHSHKHIPCQTLNLILITLLHHRFCEGPRLIKGGEMNYIPVLVWWRMEKSPSYGVCFIYLFHLFLSPQTQIKRKNPQLYHISPAHKRLTQMPSSIF